MANYRNGIASKNAIIEAAKRLFYEQGFRGTTYRDISAAAKVRIGTISYHFENLLAIAATIEAEANRDLHRQMVELLGSEYSAFDLAVMEVLIYWTVFFKDPGFRRFHSEFQSGVIQDDESDESYFSSSYLEFRNKYRELNPETDEARIDFLMTALFGVDEAVNRYVAAHFDELTPEEVFHYSFEIYFSIYHFSRDELESLFNKAIEGARKLTIINEGLFISVKR